MGVGSKREGLSPRARLRRASCFQRVLRHGRRSDGPLLTLVAVRQGAGPARLGLAVSRRVGGAVKRNRAKRLAREAFRRRKIVGFDLVVLPKAGMAAADFVAVAQQFEKLMRRLETLPGDRRDTRATAAD